MNSPAAELEQVSACKFFHDRIFLGGEVLIPIVAAIHGLTLLASTVFF